MYLFSTEMSALSLFKLLHTSYLLLPMSTYNYVFLVHFHLCVSHLSFGGFIYFYLVEFNIFMSYQL